MDRRILWALIAMVACSAIGAASAELQLPPTEPTTGLSGINWNVLAPIILTSITTLLGMYIAYQLKMVHTAVNSEREKMVKKIEDLTQIILENAKAKAAADVASALTIKPPT